MKTKLLNYLLRKYKFFLSDTLLEKFCQYHNLLLLYQNEKKINLTNIVSDEDFVIKNLLDTLLLYEQIKNTGNLYFNKSKISSEDNNQKHKIKIADIGTGNGIPGILLALLLPNHEFVLIDSTKKKITFVNYIIDKLNIKNCFTVSERLETLAKIKNYYENFDIITGRAIAPLVQFIELSVPFLKKDGFIITTKSQKLEDEIEESKKIISFCNFSIIEIKKYNIENNLRNIIILKKLSKTNILFPRKLGLYKKRPFV